MATAADLGRYIASVRGRYIDVDRSFGAQCWDQWSHYAMWLGVPAWPTYTNAGGANPHSGYACNVYHNASRSGLLQWFDVLPASATPRPGDVAFWEYGTPWYPWSHVATVLEVTHGGRMLRCLTQNPGAVQIADLIASGLIGYLRPKALNVGVVDSGRTSILTASQKRARQRPASRQEKDEMFIHVTIKGVTTYGIFRLGVKGSWTQFTGQESANALASQYGNSMPVDVAYWEHLRKRHS